MHESNTDYSITAHASYWGYFLLSKLETDSTYKLPNIIQNCLINFLVDNEIQWLQFSSYDDLSYYLINNGCRPFKDFTDKELLSSLIKVDLDALDIDNSEQFLQAVKESLTPIEFVKHSQELTVIKQMENDGVITVKDALEIFGVEL